VAVVDPKADIQRVAGKFALLLAGCYVLVVFGMIVSTVGGEPIPLIGWPILLIPAAAFVPSIVDSVNLLRTRDEAQRSKLWRRCLLMAVIGIVLTVAAVVSVERITVV
jgi:hypothetical protein